MGDKIRFYPLDVTYKIIDQKPVIHLFGKTIDNKQVCILYDKFEPYFYVLPNKGADITKQLSNLKVERGNQAYPITRVEAVKNEIHGQGSRCNKGLYRSPRKCSGYKGRAENWDSIESINENDILFARRFLIDNNIVPLTLYEAEGTFGAQT